MKCHFRNKKFPNVFCHDHLAEISFVDHQKEIGKLKGILENPLKLLQTEKNKETFFNPLRFEQIWFLVNFVAHQKEEKRSPKTRHNR